MTMERVRSPVGGRQQHLLPARIIEWHVAIQHQQILEQNGVVSLIHFVSFDETLSGKSVVLTPRSNDYETVRTYVSCSAWCGNCHKHGLLV